MSFAEKVLKFYRQLNIDDALPDGVEVMNPYRDPVCLELCATFYNQFYNDDHRRYLILGINPGRYGGGLTGIPFTDPIKLEKLLGIGNAFPKKPELSADFIHDMIGAFGGHREFFSIFFINSISPLGFTQNGKNLNYYDTPALRKALEPFIRKSIVSMLALGIRREVAFCLGEGANHTYLLRLNEREKWFTQVVPLSHPRFIMQYRRKKVRHYIEDYLEKLGTVR